MYQPQINPTYATYATVASAVVILNALLLPKHVVPTQPELEIRQPKALGGEVLPFPAFSQLTFLNSETDKIKDRNLIGLKNVTPENENDQSQFKPGLGLADLQGMLKIYGAKMDVTFASEPTEKGSAVFRKTVKEILKDRESERFLISNFKGDTMGAATGGTVSPLAAYDEASDSVLILDVTGHKNPWYWVPLSALYRSMNTQYDGGFRGYAVISENNGTPTSPVSTLFLILLVFLILSPTPALAKEILSAEQWAVLRDASSDYQIEVLTGPVGGIERTVVLFGKIHPKRRPVFIKGRRVLRVFPRRQCEGLLMGQPGPVRGDDASAPHARPRLDGRIHSRPVPSRIRDHARETRETAFAGPRLFPPGSHS